MKPLHSWNVSIEEAIRIQEALRDRIILKNTFLKVHPVRNSSRFDSKPSGGLNPVRIILGSNPATGVTSEQRGIISNGVKTIGGGDVAYSKGGNLLFGAIVVLSFPEMDILDMATTDGKIPFPYIPSLLSFREGPILIKTFKKLKIRPDVMIYDGQGIAHPRGMGLASHMGLWFDLPSIGCAKTPLLSGFIYPGSLKGSLEWIRKDGKKVGAVLRTKEKVKPIFISPGHQIDLMTSIQLILESCRGFRIPEPLRGAHQASRIMCEKD
jgi:deoxyribonuclease V